MVRNVTKCLQHDTLFVGEARDYEAVMAATGMCGLSLYGDVPVLGIFYRALARVSPCGRRALERGLLRNGLAWSYGLGGMDDKEFAPSAEDRYSFYAATGIQPAEQLELETFYGELVYLRNLPLEREDSNRYRHTPNVLSNLFPLL